MLTRHFALGETPPPRNAFDAWTNDVKRLLINEYGDANWRTHGGPVVMPSNVPPSMQQYVGKPAAVFDNATYVAFGNDGLIDMSRPQVASNSGQYVFVLAPDAAINAAPRTMTATQSLANSLFTHGDQLADAAGLPSLDTLEKGLKGIGKDILIGAIVTVGVAFVVNRVIKGR